MTLLHKLIHAESDIWKTVTGEGLDSILAETFALSLPHQRTQWGSLATLDTEPGDSFHPSRCYEDSEEAIQQVYAQWHVQGKWSYRLGIDVALRRDGLRWRAMVVDLDGVASVDRGVKAKVEESPTFCLAVCQVIVLLLYREHKGFPVLALVGMLLLG